MGIGRAFSIFIFLLLLSNVGVKAQTVIELARNFEGKNLSREEIYWFEDAKQEYNFSDILSSEQLLQPLEMVSPNFGYSNSTFWFRIKLKKENFKETDYFLDISYPTLDSVHVFSKSSKGIWESTLSGDLVPESKRPIAHRHIVLPLPVHNQEEVTFYIKVRSKGSILLPLWVQDTDSLRISQTKDESFYFFYYGILTVMIFYNLFLFLSLRDSNYFLYSVTIFLNMAFQACLLGHTILIWGDALWWVNISITVSIFLFLGMLLTFVLSFLQVKKYSVILYRIVAGLAITWGIMTVLSFVIDYSITIRFTIIAAFSTSVLTFLTSLYVWLKGRTSARFFTMAWFVYIVGAITMALRNAGVLPDVFITRQGILIGSMIEVVAISFALADRINIYRKEKEEAQAENISLIENQKSELEKQVQQRTVDLQQKQEEVLMQNEELLQKQEELNSQREFIEQKNIELEFKNTQIEHSIRAAKDIQQAILPTDFKLSSLFSDYLIFYKPKDIVSGDFYWLTQHDNVVWVIVADCTGHGVPGAFMTLLGNNLFDKIINVYGMQSPALVLKKLDEEIRLSLNQEINQNHQGMDLVVTRIESKPNNEVEMTFCGAKNSMFIYSAKENCLTEYRGLRASIGGIHVNKLEFEDQTLSLNKKDKIYLFSDGYQDQNDIKRKKFGKVALQKMLEQIAIKPFDEQKKTLQNTLDDYMKETLQRDDILVMGIEL